MNSQNSSELSELSSDDSLSPPPSLSYPSPASSQDVETVIISSQPLAKERPAEADQPPAKKRRKVAEVKPRTTEFLNLQSPSHEPLTRQEAQLGLLLKILSKKRKIVVIAGAGISVSAGSKSSIKCALSPVADARLVPDFRSSTGLFSTLRREHKLKSSGKHLFDASVYQTDSSTSSFHDMVRSLSKLVKDAKPTAFHQMLAALAREERLMRLYTQNVDGIDTSLSPLETCIPLSKKGPWPRTVQLHGGLEKMVCSKCNHLSDFDATLFDGPLPPPCTACVETDRVRTDHAGKRSHGIGRLRPRMVLYNEHNPDDEAIGTIVKADLRTRPDALIVVGTSMKIPGVRRIVREMCGVVRSRRDGLTVWINHEPPPVGKEFGDCWDLIVKGSCDEVASRAGSKHWDDNKIDVTSFTDSERERARKQFTGVFPPPATSTNDTNVAMPTPAASPQPKSSIMPPVRLKITCKAKKSAKAVSRSDPELQNSKSSKSKPNIKPIPKMNTTVNDKIQVNHKITNSFKVSKFAKATPLKDTKAPAKAPSGFDDESSRPMVPIPPQAARKNGSIKSPSKVLFPNLMKSTTYPTNVTHTIDFEAFKKPKKKRDEIVSPTAIPSGMKELLL